MEPLQITQILVAGLLELGHGSLKGMFEQLLSLTRWQQSPVATIMVTYSPLMKQMVEVTPTYMLVPDCILARAGRAPPF